MINNFVHNFLQILDYFNKNLINMDKTKCYTYVKSDRNIIGEIVMLCEIPSSHIIYYSNTYKTVCALHLAQEIRFLTANNIEYIVSDL